MGCLRLCDSVVVHPAIAGVLQYPGAWIDAISLSRPSGGVWMFEGSRPGAVFGLLLGLFCDLLVPAPFRGFFTIVFPLAAAFAAGIASRLQSRGVLCTLIVSAAGLLMTCVFRMGVQVLSGGQYLGLMARIAVGETLLTLPLALLVLPLYRAVNKRCAVDY